LAGRGKNFRRKAGNSASSARKVPAVRYKVVEGQRESLDVMAFDSEELLLLAGRGSRNAMGEFYRRHRPQVASFFAHMGIAAESVEDLTQEVFLRLWNGARRYRPSGKYMSYMFTVAANVWRDHRRRTKARDLVKTSGDQIVSKVQAEPSSASASAEFRRDLYQALKSLTPAERMTFILSEINGLSYREIATSMRCRLGTVGSRKTRAIAQLRKMLTKHAPEGYLKEAANDEVPQ